MDRKWLKFDENFTLLFSLILLLIVFRSEIIHAERKREQQTFETIEEEDDDFEDAANGRRRHSYSYSYGSEISLVDEAPQNHGRSNREGLKCSWFSSLSHTLKSEWALHLNRKD